MFKTQRFSLIVLAAFLLAACTAQEKQFVHELEDMPGITCEIDESEGLNNCHPDNLQSVLQDDQGA